MCCGAVSFCAGMCLLGIWLGSLGFLIFGRIRKSTPLTAAGGIVFAILSLVIVALIIGYIYITSPRMIFEHSFGFEPPADVSNIKSEYSSFADSGCAFLMFKASPATIERIVTAHSLHEVPASFFPNSNIEPPKWWAPPLDNDVVRYGGGQEVLIYDKSSDTVYYHSIEIY